MRVKLEWLVGRWRSLDDSSSVVLEISKTRRRVKVRGYDTIDGEELVVSDIEWDGHALKFTMFCPSTKWRTKHVFRPLSRKEADYEVTFGERWIKTRRRTYWEKAAKKRTARPRSGKRHATTSGRGPATPKSKTKT
jgi:hypothetical protein